NLGAGIDDLVQVNVEFFDQRFADDLGPVWTQVKQQNKVFKADDLDDLKSYVRSADPTQPPDGRGWIVEVHGYTYHTEAKIFIVKTLIDNISRLSVKPGAPAAPAAGAPAAPGAPAPPAPPAGTPAGPAA